MNQAEVLNLFALYTAAYPLAELNKEQVALWINMLKATPYDKGLKNMEHHIKTNRFPPTIADIVKQERICGDIRTLEETQALLLEIEEMERNAVPMPEHIRLKFEARKALPPGGDRE